MLADHAGSRWKPNLRAASAHCFFRCCVGTTTTKGRAWPAHHWRAATRANEVLPAPGQATVRNDGASLATKERSACCCHARRMTLCCLAAGCRAVGCAGAVRDVSIGTGQLRSLRDLGGVFWSGFFEALIETQKYCPSNDRSEGAKHDCDWIVEGVDEPSSERRATE